MKAPAKTSSKTTGNKTAEKPTTFYDEVCKTITERRVLREFERDVEATENEAARLASCIKNSQRRLDQLDALVVPKQNKVSLVKPLVGAAIITGTVCVGLYAVDLAYRAALKKTGLDNIS